LPFVVNNRQLLQLNQVKRKIFSVVLVVTVQFIAFYTKTENFCPIWIKYRTLAPLKLLKFANFKFSVKHISKGPLLQTLCIGPFIACLPTVYTLISKSDFHCPFYLKLSFDLVFSLSLGNPPANNIFMSGTNRDTDIYSVGKGI